MIYRIPYTTRSFRLKLGTTALAASSTILVSSSLLLTSCSIPTTREDRIGADDGSDVCRPQKVALDSTGNFFAEDILKGALIGAGAGALTGGVTALLSGKSGKDVAKTALIGGVAGGVAGAIGGYYKSRMQQGRDQAILAINNDLTQEGEELDKADIAIKGLIACRVGQRDQIRADYATRLITKEEAQRRWSQLQEQVRSDNNLMQKVAENIGKRQEEYQYANDQMVSEFDMSKLSPAEQKEAKQRIAANDKQIDHEYQQQVAAIDHDVAEIRKNPTRKAEVAELNGKKVALQKERDKKKEVNKKTGGKPEVIQLASKHSANISKSESSINEAKNYLARLGGVEKNNGFENSESRRWQDLPGAIYAINQHGAENHFHMSPDFCASSLDSQNIFLNSWHQVSPLFASVTVSYRS